jgi:hypothetical protein
MFSSLSATDLGISVISSYIHEAATTLSGVAQYTSVNTLLSILHGESSREYFLGGAVLNLTKTLMPSAFSAEGGATFNVSQF